MIRNVIGPPGIGTTATITPFPDFLDNDRGSEYLDGGKYMSSLATDWNNPLLPTLLSRGLMIGKITAAAGNVPSSDIGKYAPTLLGILTASASSGATSLVVSAAQAVAIAARVGSTGTNTISVVGGPTAGGTVAQQTLTFSAINTSTGAITVSATSAAYVIGSAIVATDGSQLPLALLGGHEYGLTTVGPTGAQVSAQIARLHLAGQIISSRVPGLMSLDSTTTKYFKNLLNSSGRHFLWNDEY